MLERVARATLGQVELPAYLQTALDELCRAEGSSRARRRASLALLDSLQKRSRSTARGGIQEASSSEPASHLRSPIRQACFFERFSSLSL